jgi:hypothetical protein
MYSVSVVNKCVLCIFVHIRVTIFQSMLHPNISPIQPIFGINLSVGIQCLLLTIYIICSRGNKVASMALSTVIIGINTFFVVYSVIYDIPHHWAILLGIALYAIFYILMCTYFTLHMIICMGNTRLNEYQVSTTTHHVQTHYF